MGVVYVEGTVTGPTGKQATVNFLVDSGAMDTLLPRKVWRAVGLKPMDSVKCFLADGTEVERKVSEAASRFRKDSGLPRSYSGKRKMRRSWVQ